jgi:sialic acid synthase SpsE
MKRKISKIKKIFLQASTKQPTYIIADMACAHEGKYELAKRLIDAASKAGADAIQFQIFHPQDYIHPEDPDYDFVRKIALSQGNWIKLFRYAHKRGLEVISVCGDRMSIDLAESEGSEGYKIHSADLNNPYLTKYVARLGKPVTLSIGGSYWDEIKSGLKDIREWGNNDIVLMYGIQNFPTPLESVNLNSILELERKLRLPVGYQDHTDGESAWGLWLPIITLGVGVRVLEKHITYDRKEKGIDYQAALNPDEFCTFVKAVRTIEVILSDPGKNAFNDLNKKAKEYRTYAKMRKVVTNRALKKGESIKEDDLKVIRFRNGKISAGDFPSIIGRKATRDLPHLYPLDWKDLD